MQVVWIVLKQENSYEYALEIEGVFSTQEKAAEFLANHEQDNWHDWWAEPFDVD